jgi:hypothetical protein
MDDLILHKNSPKLFEPNLRDNHAASAEWMGGAGGLGLALQSGALVPS